ncbi:hypothetical protein SNE40_014183 [Patella caerulea]|uniref:Uncharacterized protein n=1 Tax=Patella caerulea TaxID=87958 RepID=A0AAN8JKP9_PATCE
MILKLQGYNFRIDYCPRKDMLLADALSRLPNLLNNDPIELDVRVNFIQFETDSVKRLQDTTRNDPILNALHDYIHQGWPDTLKQLPSRQRNYWSICDELVVHNGIIMKGNKF